MGNRQNGVQNSTKHTGRDSANGHAGGTTRLSLAGAVRQHTLKAPVQCSGVGLHGGAPVSMTLLPAPADHGIVFRRTDVGAADASVPALWHAVVETRHCTVIGNRAGVTVSTVEHLMAAFAGAGIDNALVTLDGSEVPIMDGSAAPFMFLIDCAGLVEQDAPRRAIKVLKPVMIADGGRIAALSPAPSFSVSFEIDFDSAAVARQECFFQFGGGTFKAEISRARTFGFLHEVDEMRAAGLALGGSLENAVVVSGSRVLNKDGLRYDNEFVRHKVLDCIGDLYLAGAPLLGHFRGVRSGHRFNHLLLKALMSDRQAWSWTDLPAGEPARRDRGLSRPIAPEARSVA
ncbi:MAG TPA: UDP-3-O-acyl-N-acetylglucosamine deacetylase [Candidatus Sulfotelmatobacter sp.]|nr:UDP-3-O-acyl-N-acetylglucosamine deacetylase [Candidatus Sulfotelmatobacter sp.]